ncbi:MAG: Radical SAM superfamily enzyme YgiQ, UPF0313 family [Chloroflexi bacterium]|nr:MAG: Radical SAM superfamily enzyme YgiQ, UPF0313 family [Chloroflexota bacterium]
MAKRTERSAVTTARARLATERGGVRKDWGGRLPFALVYPNSYQIGMSNLGLQVIYRLLNAKADVVCERAFYDPPGIDEIPGPVVTIESQRPLMDFPVLAYTLTYEIDYYHVVRSLQAAGLPAFASHRDERHPVVIAGGAAVITNPMPLSDCFDAFVIGEAEPILDQLVETIREGISGNREDLLVALSKVPGVFVPALGAANGVERQWVREIGETEAMSAVLTDDTELSNMTLIEAARGCGRGCRFCIAGYVFRPPRYRPIEGLLEQVDRGLEFSPRVGLLGAAVADHPELPTLALEAERRGAQVSVSSLRVDNLSPDLLGVLSRGGTRTVTVAPEAGSERMRTKINKAVAHDQILDAAEKVGTAGMRRMKTYFLVGLPEEEDEDIREMARLGVDMKQRLDAAGHGTELVMSVGPLVPKPATAYQHLPQSDAKLVNGRIRMLRDAFKGTGIVMRGDSPNWARIDDICSRSDRRLASAILSMPDNTRASWMRAAAEWGLDGPLPWGEGPMPWSGVDTGITARFFEREWDKHLRSKFTIACPPPEIGCKLCGVC